MIEDEIVREVRAAREPFAAAHGYDIRAMVAALQAFDAGDGRPVVRLEPRPPVQLARPASTGPGPRASEQEGGEEGDGDRDARL